MPQCNLRLRVHAGAPSARQDDEKRIAQAEAYLDLEPAIASRIHRLWPPNGANSGTSQDRNPQQTGTKEGHDFTTFIDDTQLAYTSLESQLIPSSVRNVGFTPAKRILWEPHISSTAPEQRKIARISQSPTLRSRSSEQDPLASTDHAPLEEHIFPPKSKEKTQSTEGTTISNDTTSELPTSYSLADISDAHSRGHQPSQRSLSHPGRSPAKQGGVHEGLSQVHSQQIVSRERELPITTTTSSPPPQKSTAVDAGSTTNRADEAATQGPLRKFGTSTQDLTTLIQPAGPVTSVEAFTTHVTPTLNKLAQNSELTATYMPIASQRSLHVHERGHWEVQCSTWTPELQASFWNTLETTVGTGKAGWGVWCSRGTEAPVCSQSDQQRTENVDQVTENAFGPVRVYCWGEIVKHIYLLLFVASNSKVRKLGLRWIDAQGLVVIQMRTG